MLTRPGARIGRVARRSWRTSASAHRTAAASRAATAQAGSGRPEAAERASSSAVVEPPSSSRPARSKRPPSGSGATVGSTTGPAVARGRGGVGASATLVRGSRNHPATMPTSATGTLIQNTQRQEACATSSPPRLGPSARPSPCAAACTPSARRIACPGTPRATRATLLACIIAPPTAWTARQATRVPRPPANPAPSEARPKTANPPRYTVLRPTRSDSRPIGASSATRTSRYARATHSTAANPASNRRWSAG